jgi:hypothetical protein
MRLYSRASTAYADTSPTDNFALPVILQTDLCSMTQLRGTRSGEADSASTPDILFR